MTWLRMVGLSLLLGCASASAQEVVWRKSDSPVAPPSSALTPVSLGVPLGGTKPGALAPAVSFRKARGQSPDDFVLPPEFWPSTIGKDPVAKPAEKPGVVVDATPPVFPEPPPAKLNPWTGLPWGAVTGQITGQYHKVADWIIPADDIYRPQHRFSVEGEYLLWRTRGSNFPPLASTDAPTVPQFRGGVPPAGPDDIFGGQGSLPPAGTGTAIFGGQQDPRLQSGARFSAVYWLGDCGDWAVDGDFFFLGERSTRFNVNTDQLPVITRPFINALNGQEARELVSTPGIAPGDVFSLRGALSIDAPSRLIGGDLGLRKCIFADECWSVQGLIGYRHLSLDEGLFIQEDIISAKAVPGTTLLDPGNRIIVRDEFRTQNRFNGIYLGLRGEYRWNKVILEGRTRLAFGNTYQKVNVDGSQVITRLTGERTTGSGGLLAVPGANIGSDSQNRFGFIPEVGVKVGYQLTDNLRVHVGYDFLWWDSVVRPGEQVERRINPFLVPGLVLNPPNPIPGPRLPRIPMQTTSYWATGVNFGAEWRY